MPTHRIDQFYFSTILEDMLQYFDDELIRKHGRYRKLEREGRLRAALVVFFDLARVEEAQPLPMFVPTKNLMDLLGTSHLTTSVEPLLVSGCIDISQDEAERYRKYAIDLTRSVEDGLPDYVVQARPAMGAWALGRAEHRREDGRLRWSIERFDVVGVV